MCNSLGQVDATKTHREFPTEGLVFLPIALGNCNGSIVVDVLEHVICHYFRVSLLLTGRGRRLYAVAHHS